MLADPTTMRAPFYRLMPGNFHAPSHGGPRDCCHVDRQPSRDHRLLFDHPTGDSVGSSCRASKSATRQSASIGQIFLPKVNMILLIGAIVLVALFQTSSAGVRFRLWS